MARKRNQILIKLLEETEREIPLFLNIYSQQVLNGDASLFLGSGISRISGFPSWSSLLEPCAKELDIELNEKTDLYTLAQYYVNQNNDAE